MIKEKDHTYHLINHIIIYINDFPRELLNINVIICKRQSLFLGDLLCTRTITVTCVKPAMTSRQLDRSIQKGKFQF